MQELRMKSEAVGSPEQDGLLAHQRQLAAQAVQADGPRVDAVNQHLRLLAARGAKQGLVSTLASSWTRASLR